MSSHGVSKVKIGVVITQFIQTFKNGLSRYIKRKMFEGHMICDVQGKASNVPGYLENNFKRNDLKP